MSAFARSLRRFRANNDLTLRDMAAKAKITQTTVHRLEQGGVPALKVFRNLCRVMGADPSKALQDVFRK